MTNRETVVVRGSSVDDFFICIDQIPRHSVRRI